MCTISYRGPSSFFCIWMSSYVSVICTLFFPHWMILVPLPKFVWHEWGLFSDSQFSLIVLLSELCLLMPVWHCLEYGHSAVKFFKIRMIEPSKFVLQDCFGSSGLLHFSMISLSVFAKKAAGILMEILLVTHLNLRSITVLILLLIHKHEMGFPFN